MKRIEEMLKLQHRLNVNGSGIDWVYGVTKDGKTINWTRCITLESAELIESYPWSHWRSIDDGPDVDNIEIELVDIWHFLMSRVIESNYNGPSSKDLPCHVMSYCVRGITEVLEYKQMEESDNNSLDDVDYIISSIEDLMLSSLTNNSPIYLIRKFFAVCINNGMSIDRLYVLYIGKNILNNFRRDNGYKVGTYIKMWDGKEDNVFMFNLLKSEPDLNPDEIYSRLEEKYASVIIAE